jgi:NADP-dependent 3-hydroxy acid dehydrogenase YdfG
MSSQLSGQVVAITGASSGIGEATALACAAAGAAVALAARRAAAAVLYAIGQPANVSVNEVLVRPSGQAF